MFWEEPSRHRFSLLGWSNLSHLKSTQSFSGSFTTLPLPEQADERQEDGSIYLYVYHYHIGCTQCRRCLRHTWNMPLWKRIQGGKTQLLSIRKSFDLRGINVHLLPNFKHCKERSAFRSSGKGSSHIRKSGLRPGTGFFQGLRPSCGRVAYFLLTKFKAPYMLPPSFCLVHLVAVGT